MEYAQCIVPLSNVKLNPSHDSELYTQLPFGSKVQIIEHSTFAWMQIKMEGEQVFGFVLKSQFEAISEDHYCKLCTHLVASESALIEYKDLEIPVMKGAYIEPAFHNVKQGIVMNVKETLFDETFIRKIIENFVHTPYMWGGYSKAGIDCSGLSKLLYAFKGIVLPHSASEQMEYGEPIDFVTQIHCGDLAFFKNEEQHIHHVGILLSTNQIIHASETNGKVVIDGFDQEGIISADGLKRTHALRIVKRIYFR